MKKLIKSSALKYLRYKDVLGDIPQHEVELFRREIEIAYARLFERGVNNIKVLFVNYEPYSDLRGLTYAIEAGNILDVSKQFNNSALLPGDLNLKFRAIHDFLHYQFQQPLTFEGEYFVYHAQKAFHSSLIGRKILYSEIVLQAGYCTYFGKFADFQKVVI